MIVILIRQVIHETHEDYHEQNATLNTTAIPYLKKLKRQKPKA